MSITIAAPIGHNSGSISVRIEVRLFNAITKFADKRGSRFSLDVDPGTTVEEVLQDLGIPMNKIFLALVNGRDITPGRIADPVRGAKVLEDGDVLALSGAVPYSYGYGAPVV